MYCSSSFQATARAGRCCLNARFTHEMPSLVSRKPSAAPLVFHRSLDQPAHDLEQVRAVERPEGDQRGKFRDGGVLLTFLGRASYAPSCCYSFWIRFQNSLRLHARLPYGGCLTFNLRYQPCRPMQPSISTSHTQDRKSPVAATEESRSGEIRQTGAPAIQDRRPRRHPTRGPDLPLPRNLAATARDGAILPD